ncbi:hypothetical protein Tco_1199426 [Tanacetum coccineum]
MEIFALQGQLLWKTVLSWRTVKCKFNGKITVVILVRDRCPRGKGPLRNFFEQRIAAIKGYRGGSLRLGQMGELEYDVLKLCDEYEGLWRLDKQGGRFWKGFEAAARIKPQGDDSTFPTKGMRSIISMVYISLEGFLVSLLLLMVIIVAAVIVTVIRVVVIVAIVRVVIIGVIVVVTIIGIVVVVRIIRIVVVGGGVPFIIKLSFVIIGFLHRYWWLLPESEILKQ